MTKKTKQRIYQTLAEIYANNRNSVETIKQASEFTQDEKRFSFDTGWLLGVLIGGTAGFFIGYIIISKIISDIVIL